MTQEWNDDMSAAPRDGTPIRMRVHGDPEMVDFYCGASAGFNRKTRRREGETQTDWAWIKHGANMPKWRSPEFREMMPLSEDVTPTAWALADRAKR